MNVGKPSLRRQLTFDDRLNHELLIEELMQNKKTPVIVDRSQSLNVYDKEKNMTNVNSVNSDRVRFKRNFSIPKNHVTGILKTTNNYTCQSSNVRSGLGKMNENSKSVTFVDKDVEDNKTTKNITVGTEKDYINLTKRISKMSSLHGLPPLPKSLSGFNILENSQSNGQKPPTPVRTSSIRSGQSGQHGHLAYPAHHKSNGVTQQDASGRKTTNLDSQLAILRREMFSLRQLDLSLLTQLWSLNESIQDFRQILQDQEDRALLPPSPSPTPSSGDEADADEYYATATSASSRSLRPAPPPPPTRRPSSSSNGSNI